MTCTNDLESDNGPTRREWRSDDHKCIRWLSHAYHWQNIIPTDTKLWFRLRKALYSTASVAMSRAPVASSRKARPGLCKSSLPKATRCCSPRLPWWSKASATVIQCICHYGLQRTWLCGGLWKWPRYGSQTHLKMCDQSASASNPPTLSARPAHNHNHGLECRDSTRS